MNILEIINKKKNKIELNQQEIEFLVNGYTIDKTIADYQVSALLMAFRLNSMTNNEIYYLTNAFIKTSEQYIFTHGDNLIIDKHSSGGVGDKVSIILIPLLIALGYDIAKISGRGLGHTGGTIDKLDSIKMKTNLDMNQANNIFKACNVVMMQQTEELVPADKLFYALRDVTGTVDTTGLIVASILSKKFVLNSDYIFLDLKVGSGALLKTEQEANHISKIMLEIASLFKRKLFIHITSMEVSLGRAIGNSIEIKESIDFLLNKNETSNINELIYELTSDILIQTNKSKSKEQSYQMIKDVIESKKAYNAFLKWCDNQNVDISIFNNDQLFNYKYKYEIIAETSGYLNFNSIEELGMINLKLGGGRINKNDTIDFNAGIYLNKINNDYIEKNEIVATLYSSNKIDESIIKNFKDNIYYSKTTKQNGKMIINSISNI